jgi:hypothetical protein
MSQAQADHNRDIACPIATQREFVTAIHLSGETNSRGKSIREQ